MDFETAKKFSELEKRIAKLEKKEKQEKPAAETKKEDSEK